VPLLGVWILPSSGGGLCALIRGVDTAIIRGRALCPYEGCALCHHQGSGSECLLEVCSVSSGR